MACLFVHREAVECGCGRLPLRCGEAFPGVTTCASVRPQSIQVQKKEPVLRRSEAFFIRTVCSSLDSAGQIYMLGACMSIATFQPVREQA